MASSSDSETSDSDNEVEEPCKNNLEASSKSPNDITYDTLAIDIVFHPNRDVIATSTIDGDIYLHSYSTESPNHELMKLSHHSKSCRGISFSDDGLLLFSISKDKSLQVTDMETGSVIHNIPKAHMAPIYSLLVIDNYLVATGDDDGVLKVWDFRRQSAYMESKHSEEFISDMVIDESKRMLLTTSGEGTLSAFNVRKKEIELQSELFEAEFLCLDIVKRGRKVVVGCGEGAINIFNWGEWGNISDRFPGHPISVDAMVAVNDDIVCTGSMDGCIRAVNILPNRFLGIVGKHEEFPVENLSVSHDNKYLASCSHDQKVKFWNLSCLENIEEDPSSKPKHGLGSKNLPSAKKNDFFDGFTEDAV